jgi:energy-coupling factor transporter ATP-binding protein EcfA2
MHSIKTSLENCYGIGKCDCLFDFTKSPTFLVYAPNGTMKSSLAQTLRFFADRTIEPPCDRFFPDRIPKYELYVDDQLTENDINVLVVDPEKSEYDTTHKISTFVASKDLKRAYDAIYEELEARKSAFIRKLKKTSQSTDCEAEFLDAFQNDEKENFFDLLMGAAESLDDDIQLFKFKYNDIFDKKGNVRKFLEENQVFLDQYILSYKTLLEDSPVFNSAGKSFGTYQAGLVIKSIADNSFFDAGHRIELSGGTTVESSEDLQDIVRVEIERIVHDPGLKEIFDKVDKEIGVNAELRAFKSLVEKDNLLLLELKNYDEFKEKVWLGYLNELDTDVQELCAHFEAQRVELRRIFDEAKKEINIWRDMIKTFNSRFYVPFTVILANQEDVILKEEGANLRFVYSDREQESVECDKSALLEAISKGEQRAFYILQLLFDIESRRNEAESCLIAFDDIADSFDYKNKYAIIEYIKDLHESSDFKIVILTHNFDFYRTVASRLYLNRGHAVLMGTKGADGVIKLLQGHYVNDAFEHLSGRATEEKVFVTLIPFLRNLVLYSGREDSGDFQTLTKCLHIKDGSEAILVQDVIRIWRDRFGRYQVENFDFEGEAVVEMIYRLANAIVIEGAAADEIVLENKVTLAMAVRLKAEEFMIASIAGLDRNQIGSNQTAELYKHYKSCAAYHADAGRSLSKVILMTPENIHLNAFMYEPLIDMSVLHLIDLYNEVKDLEG